MELKIIHFYPDLMSLYGSYANVAVLKRQLEALGNTVTVETVVPGEAVDLSAAEPDRPVMGQFVDCGGQYQRKHPLQRQAHHHHCCNQEYPGGYDQ